jgi:4-aminobutyrate aminotransferase-like enzyme
MRVAATTAVVAGTAGAVRHHQSQKYEKQANQEAEAAQNAQMAAEYEAQQQAAPVAEPAAPRPAAAAAAPDYMAELQQLAQLHEQGILTDEEFEAKKKQLLGL